MCISVKHCTEVFLMESYMEYCPDCFFSVLCNVLCVCRDQEERWIEIKELKAVASFIFKLLAVLLHEDSTFLQTVYALII